MCDLSDKLIAWLDHELPPHEAAALEQHLEACAECRNCLHAYQEVSKSVDAYCDAATESAAHREPLPRWVPVLSVAAAAAALLLLFPHGHVERRSPQASLAVAAVSPSNAATSSVAAAQRGKPVVAHPFRGEVCDLASPTEEASVAIPTKRLIHRPHVAAPLAPVQAQNANWMPAEPAIQIAIPADAMFAPGAFPPGVSFTAELRIAADGSAQQLRLRP
jgi:anti-sigma factor RsiW